MSGNSGLKDFLEMMDHDSIVNLVMELDEKVGGGTMMDMARETAAHDLRMRLSSDDVRDRVSWAVSMCDEDFFAQVGENGYGYVSPYDAAHDLIVSGIADEFLPDAKMLIELGRDDDLETLIRNIADGLRGAYSVLTEWSPDTAPELAKNLEECLRTAAPWRASTGEKPGSGG